MSGFLRNPYLSESSYREQLSDSYLMTCQGIDLLLEQGEKSIIAVNYDESEKGKIIDSIYTTINDIVTRFERLLFQYNALFRKNIRVPLDSFGYDDALDLLSSLKSNSNENHHLNLESVD